MSMIIDGTNGLTFNNATTQASAGCVLQVVNATYAVETSRSVSTFGDTGLTLSITPKFTTSKILVLANLFVYKDTNNTSVNLNLVRDSTTISSYAVGMALTGNTNPNAVGTSISYLDSPATTSATTYKVQFASNSNNANAYVQVNNSVSTITLLEIAG
jgi:hypothetical protein